jgi:hypothetical protein
MIAVFTQTLGLDLGSLEVSQLLLSDLPSPRSQNLDDLGCDGYGQWYSDEDEGFVNGVGENELCPESYGMSA